jgi:hypothetical protein
MNRVRSYYSLLQITQPLRWKNQVTAFIMCHADLAASRTYDSSLQTSEIKCTDYCLSWCNSMHSVSYTPMFQRNLQSPSSIKTEAAGSSETSATSYQAMPQAHKFSKKSLSHIKILGGRKVTWSKFHTEKQQILGTTVQNLNATELWCLGVVHPFTMSHSKGQWS